MKQDKKNLFSVEGEVALREELQKEGKGEESLPEQKLTSTYYSSVAFEPGNEVEPSEEYRNALREQEAQIEEHPVRRAFWRSVLFGVLGGFLAVPAVFIVGQQSWITFFCVVIFGPFLEETVKQFGMIYLLERRPSLLRYGWQFFVSAAFGGLVFSVLENLVYRYVYLSNMPAEQLAEIMSWRSLECTLMHIACPLVSGMGLRRVWVSCKAEGIPNRIERAFPWFVAAMVIHGGYNLLTMVFQKQLFFN